ncbi:MAG: EAL domain-containing protein [Vicinamibacteria bacterium]|nr:EAL domain-containing protein [Vicinamibacteria bacterium]
MTAPRDLVLHLPHGVYRAGLDGRLQFANPAALALFGFASLEQAIERGLAAVHLDPLEPGKLVERVRTAGAVVAQRARVVRPDGTGAWIETHAALTLDARGRPAFVDAVVEDVTRQVDAERDSAGLRTSLEAIVNHTPSVAVQIYDATGRVRLWNPASAALYGYTAEEAVGSRMQDLVVRPEDVAGFEELIARLLETGEAEPPGEWTVRRKDHALRFVHSSMFPLPAFGGAPAVCCMDVDVTERRITEDALRQGRERYRTFVEHSTEGIWRCELLPPVAIDAPLEERIDAFLDRAYLAECNDAFARHHDRESGEQVLGRRLADVLPLRDARGRALLARFFGGNLRLGDAETIEKGAGGRVRHRLNNLVGVVEDGRLLRAWGTQRDVTDRRLAEEALRASEERYRLMAENSTDLISRHGPDGTFLYASPACRRLLGYEPEELLGRSPAEFVHEDELERLALEGGRLLGPEPVVTTWRVRRKDGGTVWFETTSRAIHAAGGEVREVVAVSRDVSERKAAEELISYQAYHDTLTGLPNRLLFRDRLSQALAHAHRTATTLGVMFLDLDHFKRINDTLGHSAGDRLLEGVARRLAACIREGDTVARVGGDEFTLLLEPLSQPEDAAKVAEKLLQALATPFDVEGHRLHVQASIGISLYPDDGQDTETLLKNADNAMYRAKEAGRSNYQLFTRAMTLRAQERLNLESALRLALERGEFELRYQPLVELKRRRVVGAEALLRWRVAGRGLVSPAEFIPVAEESGLIVPIGEWVLREACATLARLTRVAGTMRMAVNLSPRQFQQQDLVRAVDRALAESGADPRLLELEITESLAMQNVPETIATLSALRERGIRSAVDDFGTGHSSLSYLKRLPIDTVKIDRSFVAGVPGDADDAAIVSAVIRMAHSLKLRVVAEGVENGRQLRFLARHGCEEVQGFLFGEAVPAAELLDDVTRRRPSRPTRSASKPRPAKRPAAKSSATKATARGAASGVRRLSRARRTG